MKNLYKFLGVIAIVAVIGFTVMGCPADDDGDGNSGGNNNKNGGNNNNGGATFGAPTGVTATALSSSDIKVSWNAVSGATSYKVYYAESSSGAYQLDGTSTTTSFTSTDWRASRTGYFKVTAVNSDGDESDYSSIVSATTQPSGNNNNGGNNGNGLSAPTGVTATAISSSRISVTWNEVSGATSYKVYYAIGSGSSSLAGTATGTSYTVTGLQFNTSYYISVSAVNSSGESGRSGEFENTQSYSGTGGITITGYRQYTDNTIGIWVLLGNPSTLDDFISQQDSAVAWTLSTNPPTNNKYNWSGFSGKYIPDGTYTIVVNTAGSNLSVSYAQVYKFTNVTINNGGDAAVPFNDVVGSSVGSNGRLK